jgi:peptidoglycan/LPS O-acetylase OafA/YrhL
MTIRRTLGWLLVAGLVVAALAASVAIVEGSFDDEDWKVIGTSLGFSVYSALAAAGASLRLKPNDLHRQLGSGTMLISGVAFVLLLAWVWPDSADNETLARAWGAVSLVALAASHACIVTAGRRSTDSEAVSLLATISIALGVIDATAAILPVVGIIDDVEDGAAELFAVMVIALLLTTVLPPVMRKLGGPERAPSPPGTAAERLAKEILTAMDRIESMNAGNAGRGPEIRRECERLRALARQYTN